MMHQNYHLILLLTLQQLKIDNIDLLASLSSKASAPNVYTKQEITEFDIAFANSLNNKAEKSNTYLKTGVNVSLNVLQAGINNNVLIIYIDTNGNYNINAISDNI